MHTGKDLEGHCVQKRRLSCDSDAPQVGSARSDSASVVKVNRRKTDLRKTRPYCILLYIIKNPVYVTQRCMLKYFDNKYI